MADFMETEDKRSVIKEKLRQQFDGKIVRKDLTKKIKEGANVPVYVLEFLLGQYCSSDDPEVVEDGVNNVKRILADNFVRPDEAQKILSIEGKSLSNVVIFRLPFPVPDPIIEYKASIAKDPLMDVRVPEMVIKLKQGIGRLIRNFKDTGIVCIIDRRLRDEPPERYHDVTWASLPIKNKTRSLDELRNFYESLPSRHDDVER